MTASVKTRGLVSLRRRLAELPARARAETDVALAEIGEDVVAAMQAALRSAIPAPGSGVSAPGAPPLDPSGALGASLTATLDPAASRLRIGSTSPHALDLEYGTRRTAARPFLRPAVAANLASARRRGREALARAVAILKERS